MITVTLDQAKKQVGIPVSDTSQDSEMQRWLDTAQGIVYGYLQGEPDTTTLTNWDIKRIQGGIYTTFAELWRYRGDDPDGQVPKGSIPGAVSMQVERMLYGLRVPSIA